MILGGTTSICNAALTTHTTESDFLSSVSSLGLTVGTVGFDNQVPLAASTFQDFGLFTVGVDQTDFTVDGELFGTVPFEGPGQLGWNVQDDVVSTMVITMDNPTQAFSIRVGDLHDASDTTPTRLQIYVGDAATGDLFWDSSGAVGFTGSTGTVTESISGNSFTAGDNFYSFVGVTEDSTPFQTVTLVMTDRVDPGNGVDNIVFDAITAESIPEPSSTLLIGLSTLFLFGRRVRHSGTSSCLR